jgi:hypothetical protein
VDRVHFLAQVAVVAVGEELVVEPTSQAVGHEYSQGGVAGMHLLAFACFMLEQCFSVIQRIQSAQHFPEL